MQNFVTISEAGWVLITQCSRFPGFDSCVICVHRLDLPPTRRMRVANKGLQGFPTKNVIIQVVTGILGGAVDPRYTLPETNSSPKLGHPKRKFIFQPSIFSGELFVSGRVSYTIPLIAAFQLKNHRVAFLLAEWYMRLVKKKNYSSWFSRKWVLTRWVSLNVG